MPDSELVTVFTNGCFDILHAGHVEMLWRARGLGDRLIVGMNSDESVKKVKGPWRPINPQAHRLLVLKSLRMVDEVVVFNEDTVTRLLYDLQPNVWVKGGDYTLATLNPDERAAADRVGARIVLHPFRYDTSTTKLIQQCSCNCQQ